VHKWALEHPGYAAIGAGKQIVFALGRTHFDLNDDEQAAWMAGFAKACREHS